MYSKNNYLKSGSKTKKSSKAVGKNIIRNIDRLKLGDCTCIIRDKYTGKQRLANGSVARVPYTKYATKEDKKKHGKNLVYVLYHNYEDVVGYYQNKK